MKVTTVQLWHQDHRAKDGAMDLLIFGPGEDSLAHIIDAVYANSVGYMNDQWNQLQLPIEDQPKTWAELEELIGASGFEACLQEFELRGGP